MKTQVVNQKLWDQTLAFLKDCANKRVHIIHDDDVDGITGGILLYHALTQLGATVTTSLRKGKGMGMIHEETEKIAKENPDKVIITDQDLKSFHHYESFKKNLLETPTLIIDHHFVKEYDDILFCHPQLVYGLSGSLVPSSKLIYDLCKRFADASGYTWLTFNGILADAAGPQYHHFLKKVSGEHNLALPDDPYNSELCIISQAIDCCGAANEEDLIQYAQELKACETFEEAKRLGNPRSEVQEEVDKWVAEGLDLAEIHGPVHYIPITSQYAISSWVSNLISYKYPNRIFVAHRQQGNEMKISIRYQNAIANNVHVGEILSPLAKKFGGVGGGHAPASGGTFKAEFWEQFKKEYAQEIQKALKQGETQ